MDSTEPRPRIPTRGPNRPCKVSGCDRHLRWLGTGNPFGSRKPTPETRFFAKVEQVGDCWLWTASRDGNGYGMFSDVTSKSNERTDGRTRSSAQRYPTNFS